MPTLQDLQPTQYYQPNICSDPNCCRPIKGWGRTFCSVCRRPFCQRHRPLFTPTWVCPQCKARQQAFAGGQQTQNPAPAGQTPLPSTAQADAKKESERLAEALYVELWGSK